MNNDPVARAQRLLPMFSRPSLLKELCEEVVTCRAEIAYWQERALETHAEAVAARLEVERLRAPAPRRFLLAKIWGRA